jgi:hypothetical protein
MLKLSHAAHNPPSMNKSPPASPCLLLTPANLLRDGSRLKPRRLK